MKKDKSFDKLRQLIVASLFYSQASFYPLHAIFADISITSRVPKAFPNIAYLLFHLFVENN